MLGALGKRWLFYFRTSSKNASARESCKFLQPLWDLAGLLSGELGGMSEELRAGFESIKASGQVGGTPPYILAEISRGGAPLEQAREFLSNAVLARPLGWIDYPEKAALNPRAQKIAGGPL